MFRRGHIPSRFNKLGELRVSHIVLIDPKTLDLNEVSGPLVGKTLLVIGSHQKPASGDPDHAGGRLNERSRIASIRRTIGPIFFLRSRIPSYRYSLKSPVHIR